MKIRSISPVVLVAMLTASCSSPNEVWTVKTKTNVYASDSDTEERVIFILSEGEVCKPIRKKMQKAYLHTEVQCGLGRGWVIDRQNFDIK